MYVTKAIASKQYVFDTTDLERYENLFKYIQPAVIFFLVLLAIILLCGLISYIINGVAVVKLSKKKGLSMGWAGFVPLLREYQLGCISGEIELGKKTLKKPGLALLLSFAIYMVVYMATYMPVLFSFIFRLEALGDGPHASQILPILSDLYIGLAFVVLIAIVFAVIYSIIYYMVLYKIFADNVGKKAVYYLLLSMFVPFAEPIMLLKASKNHDSDIII